MKRFVMVSIFTGLVLLARPAFPVSKTEQMLIQLQTTVNQLQSDMRDLRSAMDERMGMVRQLVEQSTDTVNKLHTAIDAAQRNIQASVTAQGAKVDTATSNVQAVHDSVEDVKARLSKLSEQMAQMRSAIETLQAQQAQPPAPQVQPGVPGQPAVQPGQPAQPIAVPAPPPKELYENALRDMLGGNIDLAMKGFLDYLRYYPDTDLAGNAQYWIGQGLYQQKKLREAVDAFDMVLERYPKNNNKVAAAYLGKGKALIDLKDREAGTRQFRELIRRFPNSEEAKTARELLNAPGASNTGGRKPPAKAPVSRRR